MVTHDEFLRLLREALGHLYDSDYLRRSPLTALLNAADQPDPASALRKTLIDGIQSLKPGRETPSQSRDWRFYEALFYGYVQQADQRFVADQLGLSERHLRREQKAACEILAEYLWNRVIQESTAPAETAEELSQAPDDLRRPGIGEEFAWLRDLPAENPTELGESLTESLALAQPLIARHNVRIRTQIPDALPPLAVHPVALNQILLNLLNVAIAHSADGQVGVTAQNLRWEVMLHIQGDRSVESRPLSTDDETSLDLARQLLTVSAGSLLVSPESEAGFSADLSLPALEQIPVLAIDDNEDTLQLLQRYATGTRYRLIGARNPHDGMKLARELSPEAIILDVMMPQEDGWKVMSVLRQHPQTAHIPVIVCTILAQENLALSLGASSFLQKPIARQAFLDALGEQIRLTEPPRPPATESR